MDGTTIQHYNLRTIWNGLTPSSEGRYDGEWKEWGGDANRKEFPMMAKGSPKRMRLANVTLFGLTPLMP